MRLFRSSEIIGIAKETLEFILGTSRDTHPREFMALLRDSSARSLGLDQKGRVITEVLVIPGTKSGRAAAQIRNDMVPMNVGNVGSVHSHPSGSTSPSAEDLSTFRKRGERHIIVGHPYEIDDWKCYDSEGSEVELPVLDVELDDLGISSDLTEE